MLYKRGFAPLCCPPNEGGTSASLSAGVVVVRQAPPGWLFLMLRAYRNWDFPKGLVEAGEEPLHAARGRCRKRRSLRSCELTWGERFSRPRPTAATKSRATTLARLSIEAVTLPVRPELVGPSITSSVGLL